MSELQPKQFAPVDEKLVGDLFQKIMGTIDQNDVRVVHVAMCLGVVNILKQTGMTLGQFIDGCIIHWDKVNIPDPPKKEDTN